MLGSRFGQDIALPLIPIASAEPEPRPIQVRRELGDIAPEDGDEVDASQLHEPYSLGQLLLCFDLAQEEPAELAVLNV